MRLVRAATVALTASLLLACSGGSADSTVTVLAAASLTDAFTELADAYEDEHPGVTVEVGFGSSSTLAQQVTAGAEIDVFASAGRSALGQLPASLTAAERIVVIATTTLEIAVPQGNPAGITGLGDLSRTDLDVVLCAQTAPCGMAADAMLERAGVVPNVVSRELDARATLAKVALGEADAAVVYRADVVATADQVDGVQIPDGDNVTLGYPMVRVADDAHARGFTDLVTGSVGRGILAAAGFGPP